MFQRGIKLSGLWRKRSTNNVCATDNNGDKQSNDKRHVTRMSRTRSFIFQTRPRNWRLAVLRALAYVS